MTKLELFYIKLVADVIVEVFMFWGYQVTIGSSKKSESYYIDVNLGTPRNPEFFKIRVADHTLPAGWRYHNFDVDIYTVSSRKGAYDHVIFLKLMAETLGKKISDVITGIPWENSDKVRYARNVYPLGYFNNYRIPPTLDRPKWVITWGSKCRLTRSDPVTG
jgi:hypothetical protein